MDVGHQQSTVSITFQKMHLAIHELVNYYTYPSYPNVMPSYPSCFGPWYGLYRAFHQQRQHRQQRGQRQVQLPMQLAEVSWLGQHPETSRNDPEMR